MRVVAVAVMTFAIILAGLTMRPAPPAAAGPEQAIVQVDPYGLETTASAKLLRNQEAGDLY